MSERPDIAALLIVRHGKLVGRVQSAELPLPRYFALPLRDRFPCVLSRVELYHASGNLLDGLGGWELHVSGTGDGDGIHPMEPDLCERPCVAGSIRTYEVVKVRYLSKAEAEERKVSVPSPAYGLPMSTEKLKRALYNEERISVPLVEVGHRISIEELESFQSHALKKELLMDENQKVFEEPLDGEHKIVIRGDLTPEQMARFRADLEAIRREPGRMLILESGCRATVQRIDDASVTLSFSPEEVALIRDALEAHGDGFATQVDDSVVGEHSRVVVKACRELQARLESKP